MCSSQQEAYLLINVLFGYRYGRWVTRRVAVGTIATIWLLAALISFVPISLGLHRPSEPQVYNAGGQNYSTCALDLTPTYAVLSSCISFYVPCIVMIGKSRPRNPAFNYIYGPSSAAHERGTKHTINANPRVSGDAGRHLPRRSAPVQRPGCDKIDKVVRLKGTR